MSFSLLGGATRTEQAEIAGSSLIELAFFLLRLNHVVSFIVDVNEATRIAMMESVSLCEGIKIDRVSRLTRRIGL